MARKPTYEELAHRAKELEQEAAERKRTEDKLSKSRVHFQEMVKVRTAELPDSEARIRDLMDVVPIGIAMSTPGAKGTVTEINSTLLKIFGYGSKDEYLKLPASAHYYDQKERETFSKLREKGPVTNYEIRLKRKDGTLFWGSVTAVNRTTEDGKIEFINIVEDISERKWAEDKLRESELWMRNIFNSLQEGVLVVTPDRVLVDVNEAALKMFGYSKEELMDLTTDVLHVDHEHYKEFGRRIQESFDRGEAADFEFEAKRKDGGIFPSEHTVSLLKSDEGQVIGIVSVVRDNTDRKRAEIALRESERKLHRLTSRIMRAQEEERKRISMELHDEMGQTLTAMSINLATVDKEISPELDPGIRERLKETRSLADQASDQIRELSLSLRPSMLDDLGLVSTLRWYVNSYSKRLNIDVEFEALGLEERLAPEIETVVYRVVQEALTNIARHAKANRALIGLEQKGSILSFFIEDDGKGFDAKAVSEYASEAGIGLAGMRERVDSLGGTLDIRSSPGHGSRITVEIPL